MDLARIGHIGAEVAVVGGVAYMLMQQNKALQNKVEELQKQLAQVALHTRNMNQGCEGRLTALQEEIEKLKKSRERPTRVRETLRATAIEEPSPPLRPRGRRLPLQESSSPVPSTGTTSPPATRAITPLPDEADDESDPEAVLKGK